MERQNIVSIKNLITVNKDNQQKDFIQENKSQKGSIIDLLRKDSQSINDIDDDLGNGRIIMTPQQIKSLKYLTGSQRQQDPFKQTAQSQLIIQDVHLKKIQSQRVPHHQYFGKNGVQMIQ